LEFKNGFPDSRMKKSKFHRFKNEKDKFKKEIPDSGIRKKEFPKIHESK